MVASGQFHVKTSFYPGTHVPRRAGQCTMRPKGEKCFGNLERELVLDPRGQILIPRLKPRKDMNDRYNSGRRSVFKNVHLRSSETTATRLTLHQSNTGYYVMEEQSVTEMVAWFTPVYSLISTLWSNGIPCKRFLSRLATSRNTLSSRRKRLTGLLDSAED